MRLFEFFFLKTCEKHKKRQLLCFQKSCFLVLNNVKHEKMYLKKAQKLYFLVNKTYRNTIFEKNQSF